MLQDQFACWVKRLCAAQPCLGGELIAADAESVALVELAGRVAASRSTVLIGGASGTGKEVLARSIHRMSPRAEGPFVAVNCAALPEAMLEALLFGHEKGAYTGAIGAAPGLFRAADGGTLFLDEVGELPLGLQAKLLRALQEREVLALGATRPVAVDVRIIAASNRDLFAAAASGQFREDLLWRLAVFPLNLRRLAERPADIVPLCAGLLLRHARTEGRPIPPITGAALQRLVNHGWPGNVRELDNVLQRALILAGDGPITEACIRLDAVVAGAASPIVVQQPGSGLATTIKAREAEAIERALAEVGGRRSLAAQRLGISERTLRYKMAALAGRPRPAAGRSHFAAAEGARLQ
jgi:two-component system response regulator FlrC